VGYAHQFVVNYAGEMVGWEAIGFLDDEVAKLAGWEGYLAPDDVCYDYGCIGHGKANDDGSALRAGGGDFGGGGEFFGAAVEEGFLLGLGVGAERVQLLGGIETIIGMARFEQLGDVFVVYVASLSLQVGAAWAAAIGAFVPLDAEPAEVVDYLLSGSWGVTLLVGILDAENHFAIVTTGKQVTKQGGACAAYVQVACG